MALTALTANYTDSEEEDGAEGGDEASRNFDLFAKPPGSVGVVSQPQSLQNTPASVHGGRSGTNTPVKKGVKAPSLVPYNVDTSVMEEAGTEVTSEAEEEAEAGGDGEESENEVEEAEGGEDEGEERVGRRRLLSLGVQSDGHITEDDEEDKERRRLRHKSREGGTRERAGAAAGTTGVERDEEGRALDNQISLEDGEEDVEMREAGPSPGGGDSDGAVSSSSRSIFREAMAGAAGVQLPPEPPAPCPKVLEDFFADLWEKKRRGIDPNAHILQRKDFRNPSLYEKLIQFCELEEFGTNFPPQLYNPHIWGPESYYDELAKAQKTDMDRREKERRERTKVEVVSGTAKKPTSSSMAGGGSGAPEERKRSKWDQVGTNPSGAQAIYPPGVLAPTTVLPPGVGKPTVIPAFGVMKKK